LKTPVRSIDRLVGTAAIWLLCALMLVAFVRPATARMLHATLLRSTPAANSRIDSAPAIRLVFSEQVVPELSQISVVDSAGTTMALKVANDPHDVHTLVGQVGRGLAPGKYKIVWRVLSADGHPVGGNFTFSIAGSAAKAAAPIASTPLPAADSAKSAVSTDTLGAHAQMEMPESKPVPIVASILRGLGLGGLMTGVGLLFFGLTAREYGRLTPRSAITRAITIGAILLVIHLIVWMDHVSPTGHLSGAFVGSLFGSTIGRVELLRTILAVLTLWAIALPRHQKLALIIGVACLVVSGAIGHPAAIDPLLAIPAKILHLLAATAWLGGLVWLVWLATSDEAAARAEAARVSSIALISVIVVALSGLAQAVMFLNTVGDLIHSTYGKLVLAKIIGVVILVGYGAYNRFGLLPSIAANDSPAKLAKSVRQEITLMMVLILIGGFLAYVPTPPVAQSAMNAQLGSLQ
jgi:copper transport protein